MRQLEERATVSILACFVSFCCDKAHSRRYVLTVSLRRAIEMLLRLLSVSLVTAWLSSRFLKQSESSLARGLTSVSQKLLRRIRYAGAIRDRA